MLRNHFSALPCFTFKQLHIQNIHSGSELDSKAAMLHCRPLSSVNGVISSVVPRSRTHQWWLLREATTVFPAGPKSVQGFEPEEYLITHLLVVTDPACFFLFFFSFFSSFLFSVEYCDVHGWPILRYSFQERYKRFSICTEICMPLMCSGSIGHCWQCCKSVSRTALWHYWIFIIFCINVSKYPVTPNLSINYFLIAFPENMLYHDI